MPILSKSSTFSAILRLTFEENRYYFTCFWVYLCIGALGLWTLSHGDLLLYFSNHRSFLGDFFFKNATKLGEEWTYIFFVICFLFIRYRYALLVPITGLVVTIISFLAKSFFQQPRPSIYYENLGTLSDLKVVEGIRLVKGLTSFPSGHTMSAFALFTLVALLSKRKKGMAILLFLMAVATGVSRVYLVQHFLRDIYLGSLLGVAIGVLLYCTQKLYPIDEKRLLDRKLG